MDWKKIKSEYITDENSSYTKLSKKYNVSRSTIANKAGREGWASDKERYQNELVTKTIASVQKKEIDKIARIQGLTDRLLDKLEKAINELDIHQIKNSIKTKVIEYNNIERPDKPTKEVIEEKEEILEVSSIVDRLGLKNIASALKDIKEVQMIKTELDEQEQKARIAKLQKEAQEEKEDKDIKVTIDESLEDYSK